MALSLQSRQASCRQRTHTRRVGRVTTVVPVKAGLGDIGNWITQGILRTFTPPDDKGPNWSGTATPFTGRINRDRRPFKDGYGGKPESSASESVAAVADAVPEESAKQQNDVMDYIGGALERVVGHNFKGDRSEPDWSNQSTGMQGWKGDIHAGQERGERGFHSQKH